MENCSKDLAQRIACEHSYSKLLPFRSSIGAGGQDASFPTVVLFSDRIKGRRDVDIINYETTLGARSNTLVSQKMDADRLEFKDHLPNNDENELVDVTQVEPPPFLPYDERKVGTIMVECARHINLVKIPAENSDDLLENTLAECGHQEKALLQLLVEILQGDHLARLTCTNVANEPIKRRLNTDRAARQFRKALADIKWDPQLTYWVHETLLQVLNNDLLPIYLDILQVLKAKCPVLVEQMIHTSMNMVGGEQAFGLLLKRPWNPSAGMYSMDKQVKFDPAPIFVSLPYSTTGLGGRRWRMWHNQLGAIGRVYPIILPDSLTDMSKSTSLSDIAEQMLLSSLSRVHELRVQFPSRPVVLLGFSLAGRIAAKIAEVEYISCIVSLGLTSAGMNHKWEFDSDPFKDCKVPTVFAVGTEGRLSSPDYIEELRKKMQCPTSLLVVGGGDDLLRLSIEDMYQENLCQSIVDRSVLDKIYEFMVHNLPCSYPEDHHRHTKKKRASHTEDIGSTFLTPAVSHSQVVLTSPTEEEKNEGKNFNFNNSTNPLWKTFLNIKHGGRTSPGTNSGSVSPNGLSDKRVWQEGPIGMPAPKRPALIPDSIPKVGRPRSKSMVTKTRKKQSVRSRSMSSDQNNTAQTSQQNTLSPVPFNIALNSNHNNNNSNTVDCSPPGFLAIPHAQFTPLPITPPRNPYEDQAITIRKLDPKTLKHLQRK